MISWLKKHFGKKEAIEVAAAATAVGVVATGVALSDKKRRKKILKAAKKVEKAMEKTLTENKKSPKRKLTSKKKVSVKKKTSKTKK